jgi:dihydroorotase-like cyclic amidohydrolase
MTDSDLIKLRGLVDLHVHLRDPGQTHKENFFTGTRAALAGGFTTVIDMPNNARPITTKVALDQKIKSAERQIVADTGFYFGSLGDNLEEFVKVSDQVFGLKLYLNVTTGGYLLDKSYLEKIYRAWPMNKPILVHAEADVVGLVMQVVEATGHPTHVCHISSRAELEPVLLAKKSGLPVTGGVTPHHLFLTDTDSQRLGVFGGVKPSLKSASEQAFLWEHLDDIDVVESDHAPHTSQEKEDGSAPYGMPGLETTLPMLLGAVRDGRLELPDIERLCGAGPRKILGLPEEDDTYILVEQADFTISGSKLMTKAKWTPFEGMTAGGRVRKVVIRGTTAFENGEVVAKPGSGRLLRPVT